MLPRAIRDRLQQPPIYLNSFALTPGITKGDLMAEFLSDHLADAEAILARPHEAGHKVWVNGGWAQDASGVGGDSLVAFGRE